MRKQNSTKTKFYFLHYLFLAFTCLTLLFSINAFAADEPEKNKVYDDYQLDEMIVTASKRPRKLQEIPVSIMALPGGMLETRGVDTLEDMGTMVSGLEIVSGGDGALKLSVRGVTNMIQGLESTAAVGYYLDETPISAISTSMPEIATWDVERIEVLRGPQGTLFGEGSMAGTLRIITKKPDSSEMGLTGKIAAEISHTRYGSASISIKAMLNAPVIQDKLAFRMLISDKSDGGWIDVPDLNLTDTNETKGTAFRFATLFTPSEKLTIEASIYHSEDDILGVGAATSVGMLDPASWNPGPLLINELDTADHERTIANLTVEYDFGFASLVSASSYFKSVTHAYSDVTVFLPAYFGVMDGFGYDWQDPVDIELYSQELRLVSNGDETLDWTVGAFYKQSKRTQDNGYHFDMEDTYGVIQEWIWGYYWTGDPIVYGLPILDLNHDRTVSNVKSYALFADFDFELGEKFSIGAGLRYYSEERDYQPTAIVPSLTFNADITLPKSEADDSALTPKIVINYKPNDKVLLFAKASRGFRSGGTNAVAQAFPLYNMPAGYEAEMLDSIEFGCKTSLWDGVLMNAYVYYNDWTDLQLEMLTYDGRYMYFDNAGSAESYGAEFELMAPLPVDGLSMNLNLSYINAEITEDVLDATDYVVAEKGNKIPYAPEFKGTFGLQYVKLLTGDLYGVMQGTYTYKSETYNDATNNELVKNDDMHQINASLSLESESWTITLFCDNLLDRDDTTYRRLPVSSLPDMVYNTYIRPRTIGIRASIEF